MNIQTNDIDLAMSRSDLPSYPQKCQSVLPVIYALASLLQSTPQCPVAATRRS